MDADRNLLFGVIALQGDLIDARQFAEACAAWAARKDQGLGDLLVERGWIEPEGRQAVELLLRQKLRKHGDNARKSLADAAVASPLLHATLDGLRRATGDPDVNQSLADLPCVGTSTVKYLEPLGTPPVAGGRYTRTTMHARGGIGQVWVARDAELDREVALKELRPEQVSNDAVLRRFVQEAKITGQLDHPGVVPVYELAHGADGAGGCPYYTMRFIRGRTLSEAIADYHRKRASGTARPIDLATLMQAFLGVCNTVAYAHNRGVIHRDLKGLNIVLGDFGEVILIDWGLAKLVDRPPGAVDDDPLATAAWNPAGEVGDSGLTVAGQALGTPAFMAPEQAAGQLDRIDRRTDVYGLGAILYELLAGRPPFAGASTIEVLRKVREESPEPPRRLNPRAPRALEAVCLKALAKDPAARYATAAELAEEVRHWLANEPVTAYAEPWTVRGRRWVSRHRTLVTSAAAALLVATACLGVLLALQSRANRTLEASLARELQAKDTADEQARYGQQAMDAFSTGVIRDDLLQRPELIPLRRRFVEIPLNYYRSQILWLEQQRARREAIDPQWLRQVFLALSNIASLQSLLGNRDDAIAARKQAVALHDAYPSYDPAAAARAALELGNLLRLAGRPAEAEASLRNALARCEALADPDNPTTLVQLALTRSDLGLFLADSNRLAEGLQLLEQARELQESLCDDRPSYSIRQNLASTFMILGNAAETEGQYDASLRHHQRSLSLFEDLLTKGRGNEWEHTEIARSLNNVGLALTRTGQPEAGLRALQRGRSLRETLLAKQPLNIEARSDLARSHYHLALHALLTAAPTDAESAIDRADELYRGVPPKGPEDVYFQACLLALRAERIGAGKPAEALPPDERSRRGELANQAMDRLRQAAAMGYNTTQRIEKARALQVLHDRPDFRELLRSLAAR